MNRLPSNWSHDRLKDIAWVNSSSLPANTNPDYEFDYLEISNVDYHGVIDAAAIDRLRYEDAPSRARRRVDPYSIIISSVRPNLQAAAFFAELRNDLVCSTGFNVVTPDKSKLYQRFAYYYLISEEARQYFEATAKGVGYPAIDDKDFLVIQVPLPPIEEQERIAAFLDVSCTELDESVAAKRQQLNTLDSLRKSTLHEAFAELDGFPVERVKDVSSKIGSGVTPEGGAAGYLGSGIPLLRSQNVHFDGLRLDDVAYISEDTHAAMSNSQLRPKDVLLNITGASIGRCTFIPADFGEGNVNQHVCIVRPGPKIDYRFLAAFLSSPAGQDQVFSTFTGASRQGLSHKELGLIRIPFPPLEIQLNVLAELERNNRNHSNVRQCIESQIENLVAYRKSLIYECVTGKRQITERELSQVQAHA
jgi:type I restriction enzyme S subunit